MPTSQPSAIRPTILLIDNDPLMFTLMAALLHNAGNECHCARDPEAALKAARTLPLDLVIADVDLPQDDGLELCRELKAQPNLTDVPLIILSGSQMAETMQKVRQLDNAFYLRKPYDPNVLLEMVDKALWMPHLVHAHLTLGETIKPNLKFAAVQLPSMGAASV